MTEEAAQIIIVEDNAYDAEIILQGFQQYNPLLRAKVLTDGHEALRHIPAVCADTRVRSYLRLVLLDLKLPKVHGLEVLRQLRAEQHTKDLPIVVFTSSLDEKDKIESYNHGANDYVVKPVGFAEFMEVVGRIYKTWIEGNRQE